MYLMNLVYFKKKEFLCPCCGKANMDNEFLEELDAARHFAGVSFKLTSAYRCMSHNKKVNGSETSSHLKGLAVDIFCDNSAERVSIIDGLLQAGFTRIGIAHDFIHVDGDPDKQDAVWLY